MKKTNQIIILFLVISLIKILINLSTKYLVHLDSWVIYHILDSIINNHEILPRAILYSYYPLSYLFLLPFSKLFGILFTLKFIYPLITSLVVIPSYYLSSIFFKGPKILISTLILTLIDDFLLRSVAITPQGIALIFLFSSMYFLLKDKKGFFLLFGLLTILTHHLTSLILFAFVIGYLIDSILKHKEKNINLMSNLKSIFRITMKEKASIIYLALSFLSWFTIANLTHKNVLSIYFIIKLLPFTMLILIILFLFTQKYETNILRFLRSIKIKYLFFASTIIILGLFFYVLNYSTHSFISSYSYKAIFLIPIYIIAPIIGIPYLLKSKDRLWRIFSALLLVSFISIIILKLNCVFDAYRFPPFILIPLTIIIVRKSKKLGYLLLLLVISSFASHLFVSYNTLTYNEKQIKAALWAKDNLEQVTIATDTKMSALFLGLANKPATFEGSFWLFSQDDLLPWIKTFNKYRFIEYPIRYIATSKYMYETGADISWSATDYILTERNIQNYNKIGQIVLNNADVIIWEINKTKLENATELRIEPKEKGFVDSIIARLFPEKDLPSREGKLVVDLEVAYGCKQ